MSTFRHDCSRPAWVLLYLHDWDPKREDGSQPIYPEIHGIYESEKIALDNQREMINPDKYWVHKAYYIDRKGPQS